MIALKERTDKYEKQRDQLIQELDLSNIYSPVLDRIQDEVAKELKETPKKVDPDDYQVDQVCRTLDEQLKFGTFNAPDVGYNSGIFLGCDRLEAFVNRPSLGVQVAVLVTGPVNLHFEGITERYFEQLKDRAC